MNRDKVNIYKNMISLDRIKKSIVEVKFSKLIFFDL